MGYGVVKRTGDGGWSGEEDGGWSDEEDGGWRMEW